MNGILSFESRILSNLSLSAMNSGLLASSPVLVALRSRTQERALELVTSSSHARGSCCSWPETVGIELTKKIKTRVRIIARFQKNESFMFCSKAKSPLGKVGDRHLK